MSRELLCPLCAANDATDFFRDKRREYLRCTQCALVFVPPQYYLGREREKAEYDLHQNLVDDPGYRRFLGRLAQPLLQRIPAGASGLDFGCGPGPALAAMFTEAGCKMQLYDVFYQTNEQVLQNRYDFISATEVVEHLHEPGRVLGQLWGQLRPGGWLGIMTKLVISAEAFAHWHYKNDPTHVCFFSEKTWQWWAKEHNARLELIGSDVILLAHS